MNIEPDSKISKKQQKIVETATDLFFRYGVKRVSVEEICQKANVSKMTFYRYFDNKAMLAERIIHLMFAEAKTKLETTMQLDIPFTEKLDIMLKYKLSFIEKMSAEYIQEYIAMASGTLAHEWLHIVMQFIAQAQQRGEIRADLRPEFIMMMADKMSEVVKDERILQLYADYSKLTRDVWNLFYYGLLPRNDDGEEHAAPVI